MLDAELLHDFVEEAREHLGDIEMQLLQVEAMGSDINDDLVNTVFRDPLDQGRGRILRPEADQ